MKKALVLTFVLLFGLGVTAFAGPLSGSWVTDIDFGLAQTPTYVGVHEVIITDFDSDLTINYTIGGWTFGSVSGFGLEGWYEQAFSAAGALGAFTFGSDLKFSPADAAFTYWDSTAGVSIAGVSFDAQFLLDGGPIADPRVSRSGWKLGASGVAGDLTVGATAFFNARSTVWPADRLHRTFATGLIVVDDVHCFCFTSVVFTASFPFACIDTDIRLGFSATGGFDNIRFRARNIVVPGFPWMVFDLATTFETGVDGKALDLIPRFALVGDWACIVMFSRVDFDDVTFTVTGIQFYGVELSYTWDGVTFTSRSEFVGAGAPGRFISGAYWQVITIESVGDICCGPFTFEVATYFDSGSEMLFDWGKTEIEVGMTMDALSVDFGLEITDDGFEAFSVGFGVTW